MHKNKKPNKRFAIPKVLQTLTGISEVKPRVSDAFNISMDMPLLSMYSPTEQTALFKNTYVTDNDRNSFVNPNSPQSIISYISPIHESISDILNDSKMMRSLAPEINQASTIRVSSIMSPNDLQEGSFSIEIRPISGIPDKALVKIADVLKTYFNEELELGYKAAKWVDQCLYGPGAVPIFIFPNSQLIAMRNTGLMNKDAVTIMTGATESFRDKLQELHKVKIYSSSSMDYKLGLESLSSVEKAMMYSGILEDVNWTNTAVPGSTDNLIPALDSITATLTKKLEEGDSVILSENPEIIKFSGSTKKFNQKNVTAKLHKYLSDVMQYEIDEFIDLNEYSETQNSNIGHPLFMELPAESVIPIHVPSDPTAHLGYFVIIDENGNPLRAEAINPNMTATTRSGGSSTTRASYQAMFGNSAQSLFSICGRQDEAVVARLYNQLLDKHLKNQLGNMGIHNVDIDKSNAIMATMLQRLLFNKRTRLVYIPTDLLKYICFDYRENGTGKSLLEDIHFILSLRTTFKVAAIMGMARDSVRHRNLTVTMADQETDPESVLEMIGQTFVNNERLKMSLDPVEIGTSIARASLSIIPENLRNCAFKIDKSVDSPNGSSANTDLLEALTNMLITALGVPYSALNQLGDAEYARSITTTNLFFSKQIKRDQRVLCKKVLDIIKTYINYSPKLKEAILNIFKEYRDDPNLDIDKLNTDKALITSTTDTVEKLKNSTLDNKEQMIGMVVQNILVSLPSPDIAPDQAQYEELQKFSDILDRFMSVYFSDEFLPSDDMNAQGTIKLIRAHIKKTMLDDFIKKHSSHYMLKLPEFDDLNSLPFQEIYQTILNITKGIMDTKRIFSNAGGGDQFGGGGGSEYGEMGGIEDENMNMGTEEPVEMSEAELEQPNTDEPKSAEGTPLAENASTEEEEVETPPE